MGQALPLDLALPGSALPVTNRAFHRPASTVLPRLGLAAGAPGIRILSHEISESERELYSRGITALLTPEIKVQDSRKHPV